MGFVVFFAGDILMWWKRWRECRFKGGGGGENVFSVSVGVGGEVWGLLYFVQVIY